MTPETPKTAPLITMNEAGLRLQTDDVESMQDTWARKHQFRALLAELDAQRRASAAKDEEIARLQEAETQAFESGKYVGCDWCAVDCRGLSTDPQP